MKKLFTYLTLLTFTTSVLICDEPLPADNPETPPPIYAAPDAPLPSRSEEPKNSNFKKAMIGVLGTLVTITIGLLVSGANTGKHIKPSAERETTS